MAELTDRTLGEDREILELSTGEENRQVALALAGQARRRILILSRDLDHTLFDNEAFQQAASDLARRSPQAHVHILVHDAQRAIKNGHRLVDLAQRLSSRVEIRRTAEEFVRSNEAFLVVDESGYLRRPVADRYEASASFCAPKEVRELAKFFTEVWQQSHAEPQLRRLHL